MTITRQDFLNATLDKISQVYVGKRNCCRCGCAGNYTATSYMIDPRSEVNDTQVKRKLTRAKKLVEAGADVEYGDTYVDIESGFDRCYTFYFDEVKN